jgi:3-hydroxymyristoyl/3-hydroxydecanoyl-(acyl carrier protein) dehydratase
MLRAFRMPLDPAFVDDCPYGPDALFIDEIVEIDAAQSRVVCRMPVHDELPLTRSQRVHPTRHPRHVNGGLMIHVTGMVGFVHAYYVLGLRHAEGWIGYGARIHGARFATLAKPGAPLVLEGRATRVRRSEASIVARYAFAFTQDGATVYEGDQTALWMKVRAPSEP